MNKITTVKRKYNTMSPPAKASLWYTICNVINKSIALLSTPIFTRIMTEEQYGTFSIFQSWCAVLIIFTSLNVFMSGYQKGLILYKNDISRFTASQLGLTTTITIALFLVYLLDTPFWTKVFDLKFPLMVAMFLELLLMPALELWSTQQRFDYKYKKYAIITMGMSILSILGGVVAVLNANNNYKIEARVFSDVFAKTIFSGILFIFIFSSGKCFFDKKFWKYSLAFNLPLIPHYLSNYILNQSDRVMIGRMVGNSQAAYYSVAYTIATVMILIVTAINNSLVPYIYKSIAANDTGKIKNATRPLVILIAFLCLITMIFAPEVIHIFAGAKYLDAIYVIPPIATSVFFIFIYSLFSNIEYYYQKTGFIAIATSVCAVINLFLNYICIKQYGYHAAGYTTLFCYICLATFHYIFYKKVLKSNNIHDKIYDVKLILILSTIIIGTMFFIGLTYKLIWVRYSFLIIIILISIIFRKKLLQTLSQTNKLDF